jgi:Cu-processing system ATP-binding protein
MKRLDLDRISVRFGKVQALCEASLDISAGETVVLAGPNGAGKSTLIHVLLGLVRPNDGGLRVDGKHAAVDNRFKERLGYLPEAVAFADNLSGLQVMRFFARARGVPKRRIGEVLERVGLAAAAKRAVRGYSRGMRQRLGLGLAILSQPHLLILDEPTGGLDQEGLKVLWSVLAEWREAGRMALVATHDLTLVEQRVDRICLLSAGRVRAFASPSALRREVDLPVRVSFSLANGAGPALAARVSEWNEEAAVVLDGGELTVEVRAAELVALMDLRAATPGAVTAMRVEEPGLDVVYEQLLAAAEASNGKAKAGPEEGRTS